MKRITIACLILLLLAVETSAVIVGGNRLQIDLTQPDDAKQKATWAYPDKVDITDKGLGWDGEANSSYDGWILTQPIGVGLSWRPAQSVSVRVNVTPMPSEFALPNGQKITPGVGTVYVRHSPDATHWSDWQKIAQADDKKKVGDGREFFGVVGVPHRERVEYGKLIQEYQQLNVPWRSDEEAMAGWIVKRDPNFFRDHKPFLGYIQVLFEAPFQAGRRITGMTVEAMFGIGGIHSPPKNDADYKGRDGPWRFKTP